MRRGILVIGLGLLGCPEADPPSQRLPAEEQAPARPPAPSPRLPARPESVDPQASTSPVNAFGLDYYAHASKKPGNLVFSPASVFVAFAMIYAGARGETAEEIKATFHFGTRQEVAGVATMLADNSAAAAGPTTLGLPASEGIELVVGNRMFVSNNLKLKDAYLALAGPVMTAPLKTLDFVDDPDGSRVKINDQVELATRSRVKDLLPEGSVNRETALVVTNTIYLNGKWAHPFNKARTGDMDFRSPTGSTQVPMMRGKARVPYFADDNLAVVDLPYADGRLSMMLVLPADDDGLADVEDSLTPTLLDGWAKKLSATKVTLLVPIFRVEPTGPSSLRSTLIAMGMPRVFDSRAEFDIANEPLFIANAFHQAFIAVNEEGTEAAAAAGVIMQRKKKAKKVPLFFADHPFLFFVRDRETGTVLFMGRVTKPEW